MFIKVTNKKTDVTVFINNIVPMTGKNISHSH